MSDKTTTELQNGDRHSTLVSPQGEEVPCLDKEDGDRIIREAVAEDPSMAGEWVYVARRPVYAMAVTADAKRAARQAYLEALRAAQAGD